MNRTRIRKRLKTLSGFVLAGLLIFASAPGLAAQPTDKDIAKKLQGFDAYMAKILKDWNAPGIGVGIVAGDRLVFAKGYGYRDYGKKLPYTPATMHQIASNTKLFTAVAAGLLVDEGRLTWDKPVRESVPTVNFYNDLLNTTVTLRDMLAHRTGVTRHDTIWYKSDFSRKELFDRLKFLEPSAPLRQTFLYNNLMYAAVGYMIELQSGGPWEEFVRERIFKPLEMTSTSYSIADMQKQPEPGVPYTERRDNFDLYRIPYYEDIGGVAPCGAIVSNIQDMSHWLIALMNDGKYKGAQVIPANVLKETLAPAIALPNSGAEARGWWEVLNSAYGMGRWTASYRGHLLAYHGGDLPGFHSQVSFMPKEKVGVLVFVIGNHCAGLYNIISYNVYERLLGLSETPWSARQLDARLKGKQAGIEARAKAGADVVPNTKPSHAIADYAGEYEHPAYGLLKVNLKEGALHLDFHKIVLPLNHVHYDRFDTPDDEETGKTSLNFLTNPQGDIDRIVTSLDEAEATFVRKPVVLDADTLRKLAGTYEIPTGVKFEVVVKEDNSLCLRFPGQADQKLEPYKGLKFKIKEFSDVLFEFVMEGGRITGLKQIDPSSVVVFPKK